MVRLNPQRRAHFFYEFSHLDSACFQRFIDLFAAAFPDSLNLLQLDRASCHIATTLVWPENVIPIFQPPHSQATFWGESSPQKRAPELNPIERLWEDLKKYFKGRNFDNLATFRDEVFGLINSLCPTTIVSLTGWSYILDALNPIFITSA